MSLFGGQGRPAGGAEPPVQEAERPALPKAQNSTVIAKGMTVRGTLRGKGSVQVEGIVEGEISLQGTVTIAGRAAGPLDAREHLHLTASGDVEGDVKTPSLIVDDGGCLNGRTVMVRRKKPKPFEGQPLPDLQFGAKYRDEE